MTSAVSDAGAAPRLEGGVQSLGESLEGLLEFTGATAGWVGYRDPAGRLTFPARRGDVPDAWLALQQGRATAWGFAVREGPTLLNDLPPLPPLGSPPLVNLLSCPLDGTDPGAGHVVLANKASGFTSQDAAVLQGVAHLMRRGLARFAAAGPDILPAPLLGRVLDRVEDGILVVDEDGQLVYVNTSWLHWTGFRAEDVLGRPAPFPFWVSDRDLPAAGHAAATRPGAVLPFRRADHSLFWCFVDSVAETWEGRRLAVARLRQAGPPTAEPTEAPKATEATAAEPPLPALVEAATLPRPEWLPLLVRPAHEVAFWGDRWEQLTGLALADLEGVRSEVVLDWLFPRQGDRELVADLLHHPARQGAQAVLEVLTHAGNRPMLCTFLPVPSQPSSPLPGANPADPSRELWLLLAAEPEPGVPPPEAGTGPAVPETVRADAPTPAHGPHPLRQVPANE